jgi:hypothetical protein
VIHIYEEPVSDICILHAQVEASKEKVDLPPFIDVNRILLNSKPDEEKYGAFSLSLINGCGM